VVYFVTSELRSYMLEKSYTFSRGLEKSYETMFHWKNINVFVTQYACSYFETRFHIILRIFARRKFLFQLLAAVKTLSNAVARTIETREGRPLLTVETEVNGASKSTNERVLPWLVRWACRAGTRDFCSALPLLVVQLQYTFLLTNSILSPHHPASWTACLLVCVSG
jgi:hypothetical protein